MARRFITIGILLVVALLSACGRFAPSESSATAPTTAPAVEEFVAGARREVALASAPLDMAAGAPAVMPGSSDTADQSNQLQYGLRMVIMNASLVAEVESVEQAEAQLRALVTRLGGYILSARTTGSDDRTIAYITFRIPAESFERAMADAEGLAKRIISRQIDGEDVTEQYVDLQSRLRSLEATRERLYTLLERASTVDETLRVSQAIDGVQAQIEQIQGRMKYLEQNTSFSTVTVELRPLPVVTETEPSWNPGRVINEQFTLLLAFLRGVIELLLIIGVWSPIWIIPALIVVWLSRGWKRHGVGQS